MVSNRRLTPESVSHALAWTTLLLLLVAPAPGCGHGPQRVTSRSSGGLALDCAQPEAMVFVDDRYLGTVQGLRGKPIALPAGTHRLEIRKDGFFAHLADVTIARGVVHKVTVQLRKEPF